jgi:hypothetical protein
MLELKTNHRIFLLIDGTLAKGYLRIKLGEYPITSSTKRGTI